MLATESRFDPTLSSFLSKPHTITALVAMLAGFFYVAMYVTDVADSARNTKIGLMAMAGVLILLGLLMFNDGPFVRPHPVWLSRRLNILRFTHAVQLGLLAHGSGKLGRVPVASRFSSFPGIL